MKRWHIEALIWALVILLGTCLSFFINIERKPKYQVIFKKFFDQDRTIWIKPRDLLNFTQIWEQPSGYVEKTDSIKRVYDSIEAVNWLNPLSLDQKYYTTEDALKAGLPYSNRTLCREQLAWLREQLDKEPNYFELTGRDGRELTNFMDSYGRPEAGLFSKGSHTWIGLYEECQKSSISYKQIKGRYCVAQYKFKNWPLTSSLIEPDASVRIGICLPNTCDSTSFDPQYQSINWLTKLQMPEYLARQLILKSLFCLPDDESPFRKWKPVEIIFLCAIIGWITLICLITCIFEYLRHRRRFDTMMQSSIIIRIFRGFNLRGALKQLTKSNRRHHPHQVSRSMTSIDTLTTRRVDLLSLDFIKLMMAYAILILHAVLFSLYKNPNKQDAVNFSVSNTLKFVFSFGRFVDTFLLLSGFTMSYNLLERFGARKLNNPLIWLTSNLSILFRLAPLTLFINYFNKWITRHMGAGIWWDYGVDHKNIRYQCQQNSWLTAIPMFANWNFYATPACNPPAWFLGPYSQIALIVPLITFVIGNLPSKKLCLLLMTLLTFLSSANVSLRLYKQEAVPSAAIGDYGPFLVAVAEKYDTTGYMDTLGRFGSVLIGLYGGYLLFEYKEGRIKKWPSWFASKSLIFTNITIHIVLFIMPIAAKLLMTNRKSSITPLQFALSSLFLNPLWPIINCILILHISTIAKDNVIVRFMRHQFWIAPTKLGFGIYLIHYEVVMIGLTYNSDAPCHGTIFDIYRFICYCILTTTFLAIIVHLFFEIPVSHLINKFIMPAILNFLGRQQDRKSSYDNPTVGELVNIGTTQTSISQTQKNSPSIKPTMGKPLIT